MADWSAESTDFSTGNSLRSIDASRLACNGFIRINWQLETVRLERPDVMLVGRPLQHCLKRALGEEELAEETKLQLDQPWNDVDKPALPGELCEVATGLG